MHKLFDRRPNNPTHGERFARFSTSRFIMMLFHQDIVALKRDFHECKSRRTYLYSYQPQQFWLRQERKKSCCFNNPTHTHRTKEGWTRNATRPNGKPNSLWAENGCLCDVLWMEMERRDDDGEVSSALRDALWPRLGREQTKQLWWERFAQNERVNHPGGETWRTNCLKWA